MMHIFHRLRLIKRKLFFGKGLIIDIGAGHNPSVFASVCVEKFIDEDTHRQGEKFSSSVCIAVEADIEKLPFKKDAFDFSICSHVLEHVSDPIAAGNEISRISKAGYLEVPSKMSEYVFNRDDHRWTCSLSDDGVVSFEQKGQDFSEKFSDLFTVFINKNKSLWYSFYFKSFHEWNICLRWERELPLKLQSQSDGNFLKLSQSRRLADYSRLSFFEGWLKKRLHRFLAKSISIEQVIDKMICPDCGDDFKKEMAFLKCQCGKKYVVNGLIIRNYYDKGSN